MFLLVNLYIVYAILDPFLLPNKQSKVLGTIGHEITRKKILAISGLIGLSFVFEPLYTWLDGNKWFHKPRFLKKKASPANGLSTGLYINTAKSKKKYRYYLISSLITGMLKTVPNVSSFSKNLRKISVITFFSGRGYLSKLKEADLLRLVGERSELPTEKKLNLLNSYLAFQPKNLSLQLIDLFTITYANIRQRKEVAINPYILDKIAAVGQNPNLYLPQKYLHANLPKGMNQKKFTENRNSLSDQLKKRHQRWIEKLKPMNEPSGRSVNLK